MLVLLSLLLIPCHPVQSAQETHSITAFAPLFYATREKPFEYSYYALFSVFNIYKKPEAFSVRLSPLVSYTRRTKHNATRKTFSCLWPLITSKSTFYPDKQNYYSRAVLFPLALSQKKITPFTYFTIKQFIPFYFSSNQGNGRSYIVLFPFFWWGKDVRVFIPFYSPRRQSFFGIFPFCGKFKGLWGRDKIQFFLWPLLTLSEKDHVQSIHFPWPFLGIYRGKGGSGAKCWPLLGFLRRPNLSTKAYFLWPLGHYRYIIDPSTGVVKEKIKSFLPLYLSIDKNKYHLRYYFPVYGREETPKRISTSYFFPLFTTSYFPEQKDRERRILGFLLRWRRGKAQRKIYEFFPLFKKDTDPHRARSYIMFPVYTYKLDRDKHIEFRRHYLVPFVISRQKIWLSYQNEKEKQLVIVPFFGSLHSREGESLFRVFWPLWYTTAEPVEENFAPLWTVFERRKDAMGNIDVTAFWHIFSYHRKTKKVCWEINPFLFRYKTSDNEREFELLGGLLGYRKQFNQRIFKILYFPIKIP
ncbi:hypothetical protein J7M23_09150 [Candidatus Sumerlaeota bacterium]|nr:hypothetical protein [Candidatus Sumerlaeota bacterium]